jgi:transposase
VTPQLQPLQATKPDVLIGLHRLGFSPQVPAHRAFEREEDAIAEWRTATWPKVRG